MHENKERLEPTHTLDDRCAIGKCVHTRRPTQSLYFHCRQTTEGKVASGAKAAVTQQSRECFCVKKKMEPLCYWIKLISNSSSLSHSVPLPNRPPPSLPRSPSILPALSSLFFPPPLTCIALSTSRSPSPLQASEKEKESPVELTERCFRELLGRAAYGNIKNAVTPVLMWVRQPCQLSYARDQSSFLWCVVDVLTKPEGGMHFNATLQHFYLCTDWPVGARQGQCKVI